MKSLIRFCFFSFCILYSINSYSQNLYNDPMPLSETEGKRLTLASEDIEPLDFLSYKVNDSAGITEFKMSLYADYRQWKFTEKWLVGGYAKGNFLRIWSKTPQGPDTGNLGYTRLTGSLYGAVSHYFTPNKFYVTGALGGSIDKFKLSRDFQEIEDFDTLVTSSALWGAVGYGRISNREAVEYAYDFDEALLRRGVIDRPLDENTLKNISIQIYKLRDGEFLSKYEDDEFVELFREVEKILITSGYITGNLNSAATVKLYEILRNTSKKYIFYPKYTGYQVQTQVQYQLSNITKDKTHEHYLSFSGIYTFNPTRKTNVVLSGFYSIPLDSMALGLRMASGSNPENVFQSYLPFLPDRNNLDFYQEYYGTGIYSSNFVPGLQSLAGIRGDVFHQISSVAGIQGNLLITSRMFKYEDSRFRVGAAARFDYNIFSKLIAYAKGSWYAEKELKPAFVFGVGFIFRVF